MRSERRPGVFDKAGNSAGRLTGEPLLVLRDAGDSQIRQENPVAGNRTVTTIQWVTRTSVKSRVRLSGSERTNGTFGGSKEESCQLEKARNETLEKAKRYKRGKKQVGHLRWSGSERTISRVRIIYARN